ncbi:unnamed protein product [Calypogeia fissa]
MQGSLGAKRIATTMTHEHLTGVPDQQPAGEPKPSKTKWAKNQADGTGRMRSQGRAHKRSQMGHKRQRQELIAGCPAREARLHQRAAGGSDRDPPGTTWHHPAPPKDPIGARKKSIEQGPTLAMSLHRSRSTGKSRTGSGGNGLSKKDQIRLKSSKKPR